MESCNAVPSTMFPTGTAQSMCMCPWVLSQPFPAFACVLLRLRLRLLARPGPVAMLFDQDPRGLVDEGPRLLCRDRRQIFAPDLTGLAQAALTPGVGFASVGDEIPNATNC